ncbi:SH3 domain-containing protein [Thalassococcus lentus]|uniref:SH3 domain-containing protein n=1 Tax=Thalassococcus lentus TaxID=1210524 RepID=A0ABT4XML7_9RHOB|nr:SH3 domain-containing protein [Thalassococcus lentus]MDA7423185.1 SH3 domain-containing protein [Thalassococcus lentus]
MTRVILLTFGFMGWAWYEMSGGSEFVPGEHSVAMLAKVEQTTLPDATEDEIVVTRSDAGASLTDVAAAKVQPELISDTAPVQPIEPQKVAALVTTNIRTDAAPEPVAVALDVEPVDYRTVTGSRVNLREGPSTTFGVVTKLKRGDEVEILADAGDGWVKLRALEGSDIGWMSADFLASSN